jgi:PIN domain nuclease of toxin-antitoxin system
MSNFLLDTHTFIWLSENDSNLSNNLREMIDIADRVYLSIASLWEIAIKLNLGKLSLQRSYETIGTRLESSDILLLPISFIDTLKIRDLPLHHRDPFDRMLIAQAMNHSLILISKDVKFDAYPIQRLWD